MVGVGRDSELLAGIELGGSGVVDTKINRYVPGSPGDEEVFTEVGRGEDSQSSDAQTRVRLPSLKRQVREGRWASVKEGRGGGGVKGVGGGELGRGQKTRGVVEQGDS